MDIIKWIFRYLKRLTLRLFTLWIIMIVYVWAVFNFQLYEKVPWHYLVGGFLLGVVLSTVLAFASC